MKRSIASLILMILLVSIPQSSKQASEEIMTARQTTGFVQSTLPSSPIIPEEWFEYWTNNSGGDGGNILYRITANSNSSWWEVEVWNQTTVTLNQTSYVKKVSGEGGHDQCYAVEDYAVYTAFGTSHPFQWDRWFDLVGVSVGTDIGPVESAEGESLLLTVNTTETLTTQAGTFECWLANASQFEMGFWFYTNYWIDRDSNVTVKATIEIPAFGQLLVDELVSASWLTPPVIDAVISDAGKFSAEITWNTDKESNSTVNYGVSTDNLNMTKTGIGYVTSHSVSLTSLQPLTTYFFEVISKDQWGNTATNNNTGSFYSFTTLSATAPEISSIVADPQSNSSVRVSFDTDVATNVTLWYGETEPFESSVTDPTFTTLHELDLVGLEEWTVYYYKIGVSDNIGNMANSSVRSVRTLDQTAPVVTLFNHFVQRDTLNVTIQANEEFRCEVYTGASLESLSLTQNRTSFNAIHVILLMGLDSYSTIYYRMELVDRSGNHFAYQNGTQPFSDDVPDYLEPEVSHPDDIFVTEGQALPDIIWIIADQTLESYEVIVDDVSQGVVSWNHTTVTFVLESLGFEIGSHSIELIIRDAFGNAAMDVVIVTVMERSTQPLGEGLTMLLVAGVLIVFLLGVVLWRRR